MKAGRQDLIGHHPEALIPPRPTEAAVRAEKKRAAEQRRGRGGDKLGKKKRTKDPRSYRPKRR